MLNCMQFAAKHQLMTLLSIWWSDMCQQRTRPEGVACFTEVSSIVTAAGRLSNKCAMDALQVASEDTVLYTAQRYVVRFRGEQRAHAERLLAPLIRCPHLSRYWLAGSVNSTTADSMLLAELRPHLRRLLMLVEAQPGYTVSSTDLREGGLSQRLAGAPASWALRRRESKPAVSTDMVWRLDVSQLRDAARRCAAEQREMVMVSPAVAPPLGGIGFGLQLIFGYEDGGVTLGFDCVPTTLPNDMFYSCRFRLQVGTLPPLNVSSSMVEPELGSMVWGWPDFGVGPMAGGWDEAVWAGKGLPSSGQLSIKLTVSDVPHAAVMPVTVPDAPHLPAAGIDAGRGGRGMRGRRGGRRGRGRL
jgi:hypothetical protein